MTPKLAAENLSHCRSPLERAFLKAAFESGWYDAGLDIADGIAFTDMGWLAHETVPGVLYFGRTVVLDGLSYKPDFYFEHSGQFLNTLPGSLVNVAIELDGHAFHETKEAAARDKSRDRAFARNGWHVLRFTGAEIHADPHRCFREAEETFVAIWTRWASILDLNIRSALQGPHESSSLSGPLVPRAGACLQWRGMDRSRRGAVVAA